MLIDWFTVGAQLLNFLVLVWLMKRFLYKPVLNAIDDREKRIAAELADADAKSAEAQKGRDEFRRKNEEFDQQRAAMMSRAADDASEERRKLLDDARSSADALNARLRESLRNEERRLHKEIGARMREEVFAATRKVLADLSSTDLNNRIVEVFIRRLREMGGQPKADLAAALKSATDPSVVRSAFDLPADRRAGIQSALNEAFSMDAHVRYEITPDLVGGIELAVNGQKVAWSVADCLASLGQGVEELLREKEKPGTEAESPSGGSKSQ